jgi:hypothetical protein
MNALHSCRDIDGAGRSAAGIYLALVLGILTWTSFSIPFQCRTTSRLLPRGGILPPTATMAKAARLLSTQCWTISLCALIWQVHCPVLKPYANLSSYRHTNIHRRVSSDPSVNISTMTISLTTETFASTSATNNRPGNNAGSSDGTTIGVGVGVGVGVALVCISSVLIFYRRYHRKTKDAFTNPASAIAVSNDPRSATQWFESSQAHPAQPMSEVSGVGIHKPVESPSV